MRVLLTGASGAIGRRLVDALRCAGHEPVLAVRDAAAARAQHALGAPDAIAVDFARDHDAATWRARLDGIDAVVNAVGIFRESAAGEFESLHVRAPLALFDACAAAGVQRVVQLSALGADAHATTAYHRSKKQADDHLLALPLRGVVLRPSLVFIADGASTRLFATLALAPLAPLPGGGVQCVQPVHVDDVCAAVVAALDAPARAAVDLVGPQPLRLRDYLQTLRTALGGGRLRVVAVPPLFARLAAAHPAALFDADALAMLARGNCADPAATTALLGRAPRAPSTFIDPVQRMAIARDAGLGLLLPVLRISIALVWLLTAWVSFGLYPVADSLSLLTRTGVPAALAPLALYGAAALDLAIGIGMLVLPARLRRPLYAGQALLVLGYTLVIALRLPEFLLHPFGPILKNLPLLAGLWILHRLERR